MSNTVRTQKAIQARKAARRRVHDKIQTGPLLIGLFLVGIVGWVGWNTWQSARGPVVELVDTVGTQLGQIAPDFSVPTLDGNTFALSKQRGKPTAILFMAYWCTRCIPEATALGQLQREYGDRVSLVALDADPSSTPELLAQFKQAAGNGANIWAFDVSGKVVTTFQVAALDTTLILDREGHLVYRDEYPTPYQTLKNELLKLSP
jgi:thiol-disulfide isomerase/thioredoxin